MALNLRPLVWAVQGDDKSKFIQDDIKCRVAHVIVCPILASLSNRSFTSYESVLHFKSYFVVNHFRLPMGLSPPYDDTCCCSQTKGVDYPWGGGYFYVHLPVPLAGFHRSSDYDLLCTTRTVEHNYILPSSTVGIQLHVSALYVGHLQVVMLLTE